MDKADSVADWLDTVAHDLKSPLNAVRGCLDCVQGFGLLNDRQQHYLDRAFAGLQRMEHLVARVHEISWIDSSLPLELGQVNLHAIVDDVLDMLQEACEKRQITTQIIAPDDKLMIVADGPRLWQVVDNLVSNAIKYNTDQGKITIRIDQEGDSVLVSVSDTGIGISPNDIPQVFDRFFRSVDGVRRKIEGTGLGLAITRGIVERHGGRIWVESQSGVGSTFKVSLPIWHDIVDGGDATLDGVQGHGEGRDGRKTQEARLNSEERDPVNDDLQESREMTQVDSAVDES